MGKYDYTEDQLRRFQEEYVRSEQYILDEIQDSLEYREKIAKDKSEVHYISLWYYTDIRKFTNDDGVIINTPEALVPSWMISIFLEQKSYFYATIDGGNTIIELFWPNSDNDEGDIYNELESGKIYDWQHGI